jgi:nucleoside-diphosphate-sugar epimerase
LNQQVVVFGSSGQIGSALVKELRNSGFEVSAVIRKGSRKPTADKILTANLLDRKEILQILNGHSVAIYCIGKPEQFVRSQSEFVHSNINPLKVFLEALQESSIETLVYISTCEVFRAKEGVVSEDNGLADLAGLSPYFVSMVHAYQSILQFKQKQLCKVVTIHPSAVYGGLNTGFGLTNFIENLIQKRALKVPCVFPGEFPLIHVRSLASGIVRAASKEGSFIFSDCITNMKDLSISLRRVCDSLVPIKMPVAPVKVAAWLMELVAKATNTRPLMANVQIDYITMGLSPATTRAELQLGWSPMSLEAGLASYLVDRQELLLLTQDGS